MVMPRLLNYGLAITINLLKPGRLNAHRHSITKPSESSMQQNKIVTLQEGEVRVQDLSKLTTLKKRCWSFFTRKTTFIQKPQGS